MSNYIIMLIGIATLLAFLINLYLTPFLIYFSRRHGLFDEVNDRKVHTEDTPRLGGIGIFISFFISAFLSPLIVRFITEDSLAFRLDGINIPLILASVVVIFTTGVFDDFTQMRARYKFIGQIAAAALAVWGGAAITNVQIPFTHYVISLGYFSIPVTMLWLVALSNALNMIDGIDGLSSGISIIAAMIFGFVFLLNNQFLSAIICYALVGTLFGFLFFNFPPARIFMGDSGSLFLGFILALLPIITTPRGETSLVLPIMMLSVPIFDEVAAIWRRSRDKRNIFSPDKQHLHHKMLNLGLSNRTILAIIYGLCLIMGIMVIVFESQKEQHFSLIAVSLAIVASFFTYLHFKKK